MGVEPATVDCKIFYVDYMYCMSTLIENIGKDSVTDMTYLMYDDTLGAGLYAGVGCKNSM